MSFRESDESRREIARHFWNINYNYRTSDDVVSFEEVGQFIEHIGVSAQGNNFCAWFGIDAVQGGLHDSNEYSVHLFQQTFTIPVVTWTKVTNLTI